MLILQSKNKNSQNGIKGVIDSLKVALDRLHDEIKADEKGKAEFDLVMGQLETRKNDLLQRIKMNEEWAKQYGKFSIIVCFIRHNFRKLFSCVL